MAKQNGQPKKVKINPERFDEKIELYSVKQKANETKAPKFQGYQHYGTGEGLFYYIAV